MTTSRPTNDDDPLDPNDPEVDADLRQLAGEPPLGESRAALTLDEIVEPDEGLTDTERELGYLEAGVDPSGGSGVDLADDADQDIPSIETLVERESDAEETFDPYVAAREGVPWVPPSDPVVVPDERDPEGLRIAAGMGGSALDEPFDEDHHGELLPAEDEVTDRVREAIRDDAATTQYADTLEIEVDGDIAIIRGTVDDISDSDAIVAVAAAVSGINDVIDRIEVAGF